MKDALGRLLESERVRNVLPLVRGRLLDIGCGRNRLVRAYGNGVGVDVHDWGDVDFLVSDSAHLPFPDAAFETITIIAALNHMANRLEVLRECGRLMTSDGWLIISMLSPATSWVWHRLRSPWDVDQKERGMKGGEAYGFSKNELCAMAEGAGFGFLRQTRFMLGFNSLYVFRKVDV